MDDEARSAKGCRARAEHLRAEAEKMSNLETKRELLNIAANYEQSANRLSKSRKSN